MTRRLDEFRLYFTVTVLWNLAQQMVAVVVGWQVYAIHRDPFDIGLVGLLEFVPLPLLALPAGQLGDRLSRRLILAIAFLLSALTATGLLVVTWRGIDEIWPYLALALLTGASLGLGTPSLRAIVPELVGPAELPRAMAFRSIASQLGTITGPAAGGLLFALSGRLVYAVAIATYLVGLSVTISLYRSGGWKPPARAALTFSHLVGGISFIRRSRVVLGAITLDLFVVLFGGATALLPVLARTVLDAGPVGLGILRSSPAIGSLVAGVVLMRRPLAARAGRTLLVAVTVYGVSMIVLGLSRAFLLSFATLAVSGYVNMISANIRTSTIGLATPESLRGRVNAVEMVFLSASNELGAFESGAAAALVGTVRSIVAGGVLTVAIAASWPRVFPALARLNRLDEAADGMPGEAVRI